MPSNRLSAGGPLPALALSLAALACSAPVQAQVTVFGVLDLGLNVLKSDGVSSQTRLDPDGNTSSRLGFRGTEDLGGGLRANFWIETAISPDTGTAAPPAPTTRTR